MNLKFLTFFMVFILGLAVVARAQLNTTNVMGEDLDYKELVVPGLSAALEVQSGPISIGIEVTTPRGESGPLGYGGYWGYEQSLGEKFGVTLQSGLTKLGISENASRVIKNAYMLPVQLGAKCFFNKRGSGIYAHVSGGAHYFLFTPEQTFNYVLGSQTQGSGGRFSEINLSGAIAMGFMFNQKIDVGRARLFYFKPFPISAESPNACSLFSCPQ